MELLDALRSRRSIRKFTDEPVTRDQLNALVEAGCLAPSASNVQAWKFGIVDDADTVHKIDMFSPGMSGKPTALIVACADRAYARERGGESCAAFATLDAAYACENIMLAAVDMGLGTCAIKSYNDAAVRKILQLPEHVDIELVIAVGHPAHDPSMPVRKPLGEVAFYNVWGKEA